MAGAGCGFTFLRKATAAQAAGEFMFQNHGTDRSKRVPLSDVNNTPPGDYKIPEGVVQKAKDKKYEKYFTKDTIQTVSVEMEENNLNYMLQNAMEKPSVMTKSVKIGDTTLGYAGIKTKGNWTLGATNDTSSDRFSFTLNFGKYIKKKDYGEKQNFYGCSKISFNNCFFDKTILKEYHAMRLMDEMGLPTPQYSLARLYINGAYYGVYFMVESMDRAIIERYQNASSKEVSSFLVKPSYTSMEYHFDRELEQCLTKSGGQEFTMEALNGAGLLVMRDGVYYANGALSAYQSIWEADDETLQDVAVMLPKALTWNRRVQLLSNGKDFDSKPIDVNSKKYLELLESVMDTDEAVRYFATHSFLVQLDNMFTYRQNYGVYVDEQGKSLFVPWDYDLAWGTANWNGSNTAEEVANWDINKMYLSSFFGDIGYYGNMSESAIYKTAPLFHVIYQNKSLMEKYHMYMEDCAKLVSVGGTTSDGKTVEPARFAKTIDVFYSQVSEAAKTEQLRENVYYLNGINQPGDAVAGIPALKRLMARRAVGVWLQLQGQKANVTGYGCEITNIGTNFGRGRKNPSTAGELTAVDENTGIFATVRYPSGNTSASIRAEQLSEDTDIYKKAANGLDNPVVYKIEMANQAKLTENYKLFIPVQQPGQLAQSGQAINAYSYSPKSGQLKQLKSEVSGDVCCLTGSDLTYVVLDTKAVENKPNKPGNAQSAGKAGQTVTAGTYKYKVVKAGTGGKGEVILTGTTRKKSDKKFVSLNIPGEVKMKGGTYKISGYKITGIGKKAFAGYPYLKKVSIGKNVNRIEAQAFAGCKKLKSMTIKTNALTAKRVGSKAFKGISAKAVIKVPAKKVKAYKKLLRAKGVGKKVKIKK